MEGLTEAIDEAEAELQASEGVSDDIDAALEGLDTIDDVDAFVRRNVQQQSGVNGNTLLKAAGTTAVAVVLATTLTTAPIDEDAAQLPEPVPIVQVYHPPTPDQPPATVDDHADDKVSAKQKFMKALKYLLIALVLVAAIIFGVAKGCTACAGPVVVPGGSDQSQEDSTSVAMNIATEQIAVAQTVAAQV